MGLLVSEKARKNRPIDASLQRAILDIVWRIAELLSLFDQSDGLLAETLEATLTRAQVGLQPREREMVLDTVDANGAT